MIDAVRQAQPEERAAVLRRWMRDAATLRSLATTPEPERLALLDELAELTTRRQADALARAARSTVRDQGLGVARPVETCAARDLHDDAPDVPLPPGYVIGPAGVWRIDGEDAAQLAVRPMVVEERYCDIHTGEALVRLGWLDGDRWVSEVAPRSTIADGRALVSLARRGAPVVGVTAGAMSWYLSQQEAIAAPGSQLATSQCGWIGTAYQAGTTTIGPTPIAMMPEREVQPIIEAIRPRGTWAAWCAAVEDIAHLPHPMLAVYASVASVLMHPCQVDVGAIVSIVAPRARGKTSIARLAASAWGRPTESGGMIVPWDASAYGIEQAAAALSDAGLVLDDTSRAGRIDVPSVLYQLANGSGRQRGGSHRRTWRVVTLSTGEAPLRSYGGQEGAASRTLEVTGDPMPDAASAQRLEVAALDHHGHLGPRVAAYVAARPWPRMAAAYAELRDRLQSEHQGHERAARTIALLQAAARVCEAVGVPPARCDVWGWLWAQVQRHAAASSQALRAWDVYEARRAAEVAAKRWHEDDPIPSETVRGWLAAVGLSPESMIEQWIRLGMIQTDAHGGLPRRRVPSGRARVIIPATED